MNILLLVCGVLAFAANSLTIRAFQLKCAKTRNDTNLFQALFCIAGALAYMISGRFLFDLTAVQLISAMMFGVFFAGAVLFSASCYLCGPMSLTSVIVNSSVIVPVLYSCVSLGESVTSAQIIGCGLLIITFILSALNSENGNQKRANIKWLIFVLIAFLSNGITAVIQKVYKISAPESDGNIFMGVAYFTAALVLLAAFFAGKNKEKAEKSKFNVSLAATLILIAGLGSFTGNGILMRLSTQIPAAMLYPFVNGGLCVTVSAFSVLLFREKLSLKKAITIITGLAAVIVLNL